MSDNFNPMEFVVADNKNGGLPVGNYVGVFKDAEYLPEQEPNAMTGEGGRHWAKVVFKWEIVEGEYKGKMATCETPTNQSAKASFVKVCNLIVGKQLTPGAKANLTEYVGKAYLLTISNKVDKHGVAKDWTHVSNAMLMPK